VRLRTTVKSQYWRCYSSPIWVVFPWGLSLALENDKLQPQWSILHHLRLLYRTYSFFFTIYVNSLFLSCAYLTSILWVQESGASPLQFARSARLSSSAACSWELPSTSISESFSQTFSWRTIGRILESINRRVRPWANVFVAVEMWTSLASVQRGLSRLA